MTTILHTAILILAALLAASLLVNRRMEKTLKKASDLCKRQSEEIMELKMYDLAAHCSFATKATVEEQNNGLMPCFAVIRNYCGTPVCISRFYYDPLDPDDRDYKRIHAEEVAEKLNERP